MRVMIESADTCRSGSQSLLAGMSEGRMAEIVSQRDSLRQILG